MKIIFKCVPFVLSCFIDSDSGTLVTAASPDSDTLRSFNIEGLRESASSCTLASGAASPISNASFHSALDRPPARRSNKNATHRWVEQHLP